MCSCLCSTAIVTFRRWRDEIPNRPRASLHSDVPEPGATLGCVVRPFRPRGLLARLRMEAKAWHLEVVRCVLPGARALRRKEDEASRRGLDELWDVRASCRSRDGDAAVAQEGREQRERARGSRRRHAGEVFGAKDLPSRHRRRRRRQLHRRVRRGCGRGAGFHGDRLRHCVRDNCVCK